jgi:DUF4097 and DUF4098 domain-containing protein YvlB
VLTLAINYADSEVFIRESGTGDLVFKEYMETDRSRYYARISRSGETLTIKSGRRPWFNWSWKARVEIYLPRSFRENIRISTGSGSLQAEIDLLDYKTIDVSVSSGSVSYKRLSAGSASVHVSSGSLDIAGIGGDSLVSISSGRLQIGELSGQKHRIKTSSGRMRIDSIQGDSAIEVSSGGVAIEKARGKIDLRASSGSIDIVGFSGEGSFDLSSGNLSLDMLELTGDLRFTISSGDIELKLPGEISFNLDAVTGSGKVLVYEGGSETIRASGKSTVLRPIGASSERTIYARTSSGSVRIYREK